MRTNILEMALRELNRLVLNEVEFATAHERLVMGLSLSTKEAVELVNMYDNQNWSR